MRDLRFDPQWLSKPGREEEKEHKGLTFDTSWLTTAQPPKPPSMGKAGTEELRFTGYGGATPLETERLPTWQKVLNAASNVLSGLEPLLFAGDLTKSIVYATATRDWSKVREQISALPAYAPWGAKPKVAVEASDIARLLLKDGYENASVGQKFLTNLAIDVALDPLSLFSVLKLPVLGVGAVARGTKIGEAATQAARGLGVAEDVANRALNPFAVAAQTLRPVAGKALEAIDPILQRPILKRPVRIPGASGYTVDVGIRVGDLFSVFQPSDVKRMGQAAFKYLGEDPNSVAVQGLARANAQYVLEEAMRGVQVIDKTIRDRLGVDARIFGLFKAKVIPKELEPLANEVKRIAGRLADEYGIVDLVQGLDRVESALQTLAKSYGVDRKVLRDLVGDVVKLGNIFTQRIMVKFSGFEDYLKYLREGFESRGLDPDAGVQTILGLRLAGGSKRLDEIAGKQVPFKTTFGESFIPQKVEELPTPILRHLKSLSLPPDYNPKATPDWMKFWLTPLAPEDVAQKWANELRLADWYEKVVPQARDLSKVLDYEAFARDLIEGTRGRVLLPTSDFEKVITALKEGDVPTFWKELYGLFEREGWDVPRTLLSSKSPILRGLGHLSVAMHLKDAEPALALVGMGKAASLLYRKYPEVSRYLHSLGAPILDADQALITRRDVEAITTFIRSMGPDAAIAAAKKTFGEAGGELARALASKDAAAIRQVAERMVTSGDVRLDPGAYEHIAQYVRYALPDGARQAAIFLGYDDVKRVALNELKILSEVEREALEKWWATRPNWGGLTSIDDIYRNADRYTSPASPFIVTENLRRGYARRLYAGLQNPNAVMGALLKGRLAIVPELDMDKLGGAALRAIKDKAKAEAFAQELASYINSSQLVTYNVEVFGAIARSVGIDPREVNWLEFLSDAFPDSSTAVRVMKEAITGAPVGRSGEMAIPGHSTFQKRMAIADELAPMWDITASLGELGTKIAPRYFSHIFFSEVHKILLNGDGKGNRLIFDSVDQIPDELIQHFVRVPDAKVVFRGGEANLYGPLSGKFIPKAIFNDMARALSADPINMSTYRAFLAFWRKGLLNSPLTTMRNIIGNFYLTWANAGEEVFINSIAELPRAMRIYNEYLKTGKMPKDMEGILYFLKPTSLSQEARHVLDESIRYLAGQTGGDPGVLPKLIQAADEYLNNFGAKLAKAIGQEDNIALRMLAPIELFSYAESVQRLSVYLGARRLGKTHTEAMHIAANAMFDYSGIPWGIQMLRDYGLTAFPSFAYFTYKASGKWATGKPAALLLPQKLTAASYQALDDEDHALIRAFQMDWMRNSLYGVLPVKTREGEVFLIPIASTLPMPSSPIDLAAEALNFGVLGTIAQNLSAGLGYIETPSSPRWFGEGAGKKEVIPPHSNPLEGAARVATFTLKSLLPSYATRALPVGDFLTLAVNGFDIQRSLLELESVVGKAWVQRKHPELVKLMESALGRPIGLETDEAVYALLLGGRRQGVGPTGVTSLQTLRGIDAAEKRLRTNLSEVIKKGGGIDEAREMVDGFKQSREMARIEAMRRAMELLRRKDEP